MNKRTYITPTIEVATIDGEALLLEVNVNSCSVSSGGTCDAKQRYSDEEGEAEENYGFDYDW